MNNLSVAQYPTNLFSGFWIRFWAFIVDFIMIQCIALFIEVFLYIIGVHKPTISIWYLQIGITSILMPLYFVLFTKITNGQTLGKIIFGLRVVCFSEESLSWTTLIVREFFGRYIQNTIPLFYISIIFTKKKQHFVDYYCDTGVISETALEIYQLGRQDEKTISCPEPI